MNYCIIYNKLLYNPVKSLSRAGLVAIKSTKELEENFVLLPNIRLPNGR